MIFVIATCFFNDGHKRFSKEKEKKGLDFTILCFRIVTKGDYPDMVHANVRGLLILLEQNKVENFIIQAVCNKSIYLQQTIDHPKVKELVVPESYTTQNGTKFKARNLQYALETDCDDLKDNDWVVHLDEESQITESSLNGILNFIQEGKHPIGNLLIIFQF